MQSLPILPFNLYILRILVCWIMVKIPATDLDFTSLKWSAKGTYIEPHKPMPSARMSRSRPCTREDQSLHAFALFEPGDTVFCHRPYMGIPGLDSTVCRVHTFHASTPGQRLNLDGQLGQGDGCQLRRSDLSRHADYMWESLELSGPYCFVENLACGQCWEHLVVVLKKTLVQPISAFVADEMVGHGEVM